MTMNPRQIGKLVKYLRDAGAAYVTIAADGAVTASFPQPGYGWVQPPWWLQPSPTWIGPGWSQVTYETVSQDGTVPCASSNEFVIKDGDPSGVFSGYNSLLAANMLAPVGSSVTFRPEN